MLGLDLSVREMLNSAFAGAKEEALGKIPMYNYIATEFRRYQSKQKLKGPKSDSNTVDEYEFKKAINHIDTEIGGTWSPIKWIWGLIQSLLGNTHKERVVTSIKNLENYGHQYDSFKFVNEAQEFLLSKIEKRITDIEGLSSKYVGTKNTKVASDTILEALKSALQAWLDPFDKIINGEVAEISKPSEADIKLLMNLRDRIQYSPGAKYIEDLLPRYNQIVIEAQRALYSNNNAATHQPRAHNRRTGQKLARTTA